MKFVDLLWEKQKEHMKERKKYFCRFNEFNEMFDYFENGQTVAQIACGTTNEDLFNTMERVGRGGKVILIEQYPSFIYDKVAKAIGEENLPESKEFYQTEEGTAQLQKLLKSANVEAYVQHLPPYSEQIKDSSLDHVMAINAAFELMAIEYPHGKPADVKGLVNETYKKLKLDGSFMVQGLTTDDIDMFNVYVRSASDEHELRFEEDFNLPRSLDNFHMYSGYWKRWIKTAE